ncbi:hypothetical protein TCAL_12974 [Tigriopus californicus]|uniref:Uncharacterized protein n=1 Tax=Tigriopus californicus TaxID=6832 RepID=A0A553PGS3_TIGCA|nr:hypothetical protein TCAL_12974 [Tigriopus californicus]
MLICGSSSINAFFSFPITLNIPQTIQRHDSKTQVQSHSANPTGIKTQGLMFRIDHTLYSTIAGITSISIYLNLLRKKSIKQITEQPKKTTVDR